MSEIRMADMDVGWSNIGKDAKGKPKKAKVKLLWVDRVCPCCKKEHTFIFPGVNVCPNTNRIVVFAPITDSNHTLSLWTLEKLSSFEENMQNIEKETETE